MVFTNLCADSQTQNWVSSSAWWQRVVELSPDHNSPPWCSPATTTVHNSPPWCSPATTTVHNSPPWCSPATDPQITTVLPDALQPLIPRSQQSSLMLSSHWITTDHNSPPWCSPATSYLVYVLVGFHLSVRCSVKIHPWKYLDFHQDVTSWMLSPRWSAPSAPIVMLLNLGTDAHLRFHMVSRFTWRVNWLNISLTSALGLSYWQWCRPSRRATRGMPFLLIYFGERRSRKWYQDKGERW